MKNIVRLMMSLAAVVLLSGAGVQAADYSAGAITASKPWARASAGKAKNGAVYLSAIVNKGKDMDRLVAISTPAANKAALHKHVMADGLMKMSAVKALEIKPGQNSMMKPGGMHIMLMGLKAPLKTGEMFPMTLTFEKAGVLEIQVKVMKVGSRSYQ